MPHCLLEYSQNIPDRIKFEKLFSELHNILVKTGEFNVADMKSRAIGYDHFLIGDGKAERIFIHLEIFILEGRSREFKSQLSTVAMHVLEKYFTNTLLQPESSITVNISDLNRASYKKRIGRGP